MADTVFIKDTIIDTNVDTVTIHDSIYITKLLFDTTGLLLKSNPNSAAVLTVLNSIIAAIIAAITALAVARINSSSNKVLQKQKGKDDRTNIVFEQAQQVIKELIENLNKEIVLLKFKAMRLCPPELELQPIAIPAGAKRYGKEDRVNDVYESVVAIDALLVKGRTHLPTELINMIESFTQAITRRGFDLFIIEYQDKTTEEIFDEYNAFVKSINDLDKCILGRLRAIVNVKIEE
jgi:hypothetical protein